MTSITIYDGADSIGGNKIYAEENGSRFRTEQRNQDCGSLNSRTRLQM